MRAQVKMRDHVAADLRTHVVRRHDRLRSATSSPRPSSVPSRGESDGQKTTGPSSDSRRMKPSVLDHASGGAFRQHFDVQRGRVLRGGPARWRRRGAALGRRRVVLALQVDERHGVRARRAARPHSRPAGRRRAHTRSRASTRDCGGSASSDRRRRARRRRRGRGPVEHRARRIRRRTRRRDGRRRRLWLGRGASGGRASMRLPPLPTTAARAGLPSLSRAAAASTPAASTARRARGVHLHAPIDRVHRRVREVVAERVGAVAHGASVARSRRSAGPRVRCDRSMAKSPRLSARTTSPPTRIRRGCAADVPTDRRRRRARPARPAPGRPGSTRYSQSKRSGAAAAGRLTARTREDALALQRRVDLANR